MSHGGVDLSPPLWVAGGSLVLGDISEPRCPLSGGDG